MTPLPMAAHEGPVRLQTTPHILLIFLLISACSGGEAPPRMADEERFVLLGADGLPAAGNNAYCVSDLLTGLVWESKSPDAGLHAASNTYSWYNPEQSFSELDYRGVPNAGTCNGSDCDTWSYVAAVNAAGYCGASDWRVPSKDEFYSISDLSRGRTPPTANLDYFPHTQPAEYWTAHDYSFQYDSAWAWSFEYGHDRVDWKKAPKYVRLVRGSASVLTEVKE